jgi:hypothetical protein
MSWFVVTLMVPVKLVCLGMGQMLGVIWVMVSALVSCVMLMAQLWFGWWSVVEASGFGVYLY